MEEAIKSRPKRVSGGKGLLEFIDDESGCEMSGGSGVVGLGILCLAGLRVHSTALRMTLFTRWTAKQTGS